MSIADKIQALLGQVNPSIDTTDPIIRDLVVNFVSNVWNEIDGRILTIQNKYNASLLQNMTSAELASFAYANKGMVKNSGTYASGYVFVMTSDNSQDINISSGTLFSTTDGAWQFASAMDVYVAQADIPNYYNPARSMYEFRIPIRAISPGTDYRVAPYRITSVRSPISFAALVENREPTSGGSNPETDADFITRIQTAGAGFSINSSQAMREQVLAKLPNISDIQFYKNHPDANVVKVYYIGQVPMEDTVTFNILPNLNTTFSFPTDKAPVRLVTSAIYNGSLVETSQYAYSKWQVAFNLPDPEAGKLIYCTIQYNGLSSTLQDFFFNQADIHQTQWVPEEATPVAFDVMVYVKIPSYLMGSEVSDLVTSSIMNSVNSGLFIESLSSGDLESQLKSSSQNILDAKISLNGLPFISFNSGEYPLIDSTNITLKVI